jgi:predicted  nucleic acid-binding Zn-ribbon protein
LEKSALDEGPVGSLRTRWDSRERKDNTGSRHARKEDRGEDESVQDAGPDRVREELEEQIRELKEECVDLETLGLQHKKEYDAIRKRMSKENEAHTRKLTEIRDQHEADLAALKSEHAAATQKLMDDLSDQIEAKQDELHEKQEELDAKENELQAKQQMIESSSSRSTSERTTSSGGGLRDPTHSVLVPMHRRGCCRSRRVLFFVDINYIQ